MKLADARETISLIATMIGEIMEDHADSALTLGIPQAADWSTKLTAAGDDIAVLGRALSVISRRAGEGRGNAANPHQRPYSGLTGQVESATPKTKLARIIAALRGPGGASLADLVEITGWKVRTLRGVLAGTLIHRHGLTITSEMIGGARVYRAERTSPVRGS